MNLNKIVLIINILIFGLLTLFSFLTYSDYQFKNHICERCEIYNVSSNSAWINGRYQLDSFYCVWTKGRDIEDIKLTDYHEKCHDLVFKDYYHFCEEYYK